ncbi:hypothetical protein [Xanthobacter versatilis]|uniref:hypothetical protein n=1 Tax=Xanthobacter autotrophicus (strain ATCC BAA-1158 / Py2) TaxID=78245 RepID=UPI00372756B3
MPWEMDWSGSQPPPSGAFNNATAGLNSAIYSTLGAPVDAATWLTNKGVDALNAVTGAELPQARANLPGSSRWLAGAGEAVGVNDPSKVQATTQGEKLARAAGSGIGFTLAPEAAIGALGRAGVLGEGAVNALAPYIGHSTSLGDVALSAGIGGAAGTGGELVAEAAPERYRPVAEVAGNLLGGGAAVGAMALGRGVTQAGRAVADRLAPITQSGQERAAGMVLRDAATDPAALRTSLEQTPGELVPGSAPTTFQATGDMGLGGLERAVAAKSPAEFMQRRADQNTARVGALEGIQQAGAPDMVVGALRQNLADLDAMTGQAVDAATGRARGATAALGGEQTPEAYGAALRGLEAPVVDAARADAQGAMLGLGGHGMPEGYGEAMRQQIMDARSVAKERERALWRAVDPEGTLALPATETARIAADVQASMPASAKPMSGEEAAIFGMARRFGSAVAPFSEVTALRSRISEAMRQEMMASGQTVQYARLARLRAAVERDLETAVLDQAEREAQGMASGAVSLEDTMFGRMQAAVGAPGDWPGPTPGATMRAGGTAAGAAPGRSDAVMNEAADIALGRKAPYRPPSFLKWIERNGGIRYDDNVAAALDAADRRHGNLLNRSGRSVDEWGVSIAERAGWADRPDQNEILDWIAEAANGREPDWWTALHASPERQDAARLAEHLTRIAAEEGISLRSRQAALDLLRRDAELYGLGPTDDLRAWARERTARYGTEAPAGGFSPSTPAMGRGAGAGASGFPGGSAEWTSGFSGSRGQARGQSGRSSGDQGFPGEGLVSPNFDEAALERLRAASAATRERAQTFDAGRVGAVTKRSGASGPFLTEASAVPGRFFTPGPRGYEAMQALRNAAPEAMPQIRDYAISTLRQAATRQDGTLDPGGFLRWRSRYGDALRAFPELMQRVGTAEQASRLLDAARVIPENVLNGDVPARIFRPGPGGAESVNAFRAAVGDQQATAVLQDYAIASMRQAAEHRDGPLIGTLDPAKVRVWRQKHADALRAIPEVDRMLADPVQASEAVTRVAADRKTQMDAFQQGAVARLLNLDDPADVTRTIGGIFSRQDAVQQMTRLVRETAGNQEARAGLRKAVADYMTQRLKSYTEAGTSGQNLLKSDTFQRFVDQSAPVLRKVLSEQEVGTLRAIAADLNRANRSVASVRLPGGSNTAQDLTAISRAQHQPSILARTLSVAGSAGLGAAAGGPLASVAAVVGVEAVQAMLRAGLRNVNDLVRDALLNPERAKALLAKAPARPNRVSDAVLARAYARGAVLPALGSTVQGDGQR